MNEVNKYLYHHGILGQKWGKRNGPPYPLSRARNRAVRAQAKADKYQAKATRKIENVARREAKREERYYKRQEVAARIMNSAPAKLFFDGWDDSKWKQDRMTYEQIKKRNQQRLNPNEMTDVDRIENMTSKDWKNIGDTSRMTDSQYVKALNDYWDKNPDRFRTNNPKSVFNMSNEELKTTIDRIRLENEFNRLVNESSRIKNESNNLNSNTNSGQNTNSSISNSFRVPTDNPAVAKGRQYVNDLNKDVGNYVKVGTDIVKLINNIYDTKNKLQGNPSNNTKNDLDNIINDRIEEALTKKQ